MKGIIYVEVPDEWVAGRVAEIWADMSEEDVAYFGEQPAPQEFLRQRLEEIAESDLLVALFGWPVETSVDVHGWFPNPEDIDESRPYWRALRILARPRRGTRAG